MHGRVGCGRKFIANGEEVCDNIRMNAANEKIFELLDKMHGNADCELHFGTPFQLLIAVILSAQCTDKRVNMITPELFRHASTPEEFVAMPTEELEKLIFSCGFYRMPTDREGLMKLRGVGRKTANVVYAVAYGGNAIAVDTHVFRVSNRLGIADAKTPEETERQLTEGFDEKLWSRLHHLLIFHGRYVCHSQKPNCAECLLKEECKYYQNQQKV